MFLALSIAALALAGVAGLFILRLSWARRPSTAHYSILPVLFGLWMVSVAMWNTYFYAFKVPGLFDMSIERALLVCVALSAGYQIFTKRVRLVGDHRMELWMAVFLVICVLSMFLNGFAAKYLYAPKPWYIFFTGYLVPFLAFVVARYFFEDVRSIRIVLTILFVLGVYLCVVAFLERFGLKELVYPSYITDTQFPLHLDRSRGPFLNAAFNGLAMTICFVAGLFLLPMTGALGRFFILACLPLFFFGVFFTSTRSAYLVFFLALSTVLFFCRVRTPKWKLVPLVAALCLTAVVANSERLFSERREVGGIAQMEEVDIRFQLIAKSIRLFGEAPFLGIGLAHFSVSDAPETVQDNQHNHLVGMAVELGLAGLGAYLVILVLIFRNLYSLAKNPRVTRNVYANASLLITLAITVTLVNNVFVEASLCPFINLSTFTFAGLAARLNDHPETLDPVL
jgi:hypothetical protein